jgi:hypothetical protein
MYDESKDKYKLTGNSKSYSPLVEAFSITFAPVAGNKSTLYMAWDTTIVEFPVEF